MAFSNPKLPGIRIYVGQWVKNRSVLEYEQYERTSANDI